MSSAMNIEERGTTFFPDAFRTGIIEEEGNTLFVLEFGKTKTEGTVNDMEVEPLAKVAVGSGELKLICEHILRIGMEHKRDFWNDFLSSDMEIEDGDASGKT